VRAPNNASFAPRESTSSIFRQFEAMTPRVDSRVIDP
jgi:hypothetical protein